MELLLRQTIKKVVATQKISWAALGCTSGHMHMRRACRYRPSRTEHTDPRSRTENRAHRTVGALTLIALAQCAVELIPKPGPYVLVGYMIQKARDRIALPCIRDAHNFIFGSHLCRRKRGARLCTWMRRE